MGVGIYEGEKEEVMDVGDYKGYSVLMSVYHKEKPEYLKQAIASIQAQTLKLLIIFSEIASYISYLRIIAPTI